MNQSHAVHRIASAVLGVRLRLPARIFTMSVMSIKAVAARSAGHARKTVIDEQPAILRHDIQTTVNLLIGGKGFS